jgi:hypothetical protein
LTMGSGLYGIYEGQQQQQLAKQLQASADPFASQRGQYQQQLAVLNANPSSMTSLPGYQAGLEAVQRSGAAQGYTGSGNMMAGLAKYGQDFFNQQQQTLGGFAGAGINPASGAQLNLQATQGGMGLTGQGLASLGYGTYMAGR